MAYKPTIFFGSDIKLKINVDFGENVNMDETDFDVKLISGSKSIVLEKSQLIKVDSNNYIACVKSPDTSRGSIRVEVRFKLVDTDFSDNIQNVVSVCEPGIKII